jgi:hypothetical protein
MHSRKYYDAIASSEMKKCPACGQEIRSRRSVEISTRFHGHVTYTWRELNRAGVSMSRDEVYLRALLKACEIPPDFSRAYPYVIVDGVLHPKRTTNRTNDEMITACLGIEYFAAEHGIGPLPEKPEDDNDGA